VNSDRSMGQSQRRAVHHSLRRRPMRELRGVAAVHRPCAWWLSGQCHGGADCRCVPGSNTAAVSENNDWTSPAEVEAEQGTAESPDAAVSSSRPRPGSTSCGQSPCTPSTGRRFSVPQARSLLCDAIHGLASQHPSMPGRGGPHDAVTERCPARSQVAAKRGRFGRLDAVLQTAGRLGVCSSLARWIGRCPYGAL